MARAPGTTAGDTAEFVPLPAGLSLLLHTTNYLLLLGPPALRLHPWREGGIGVAPVILLWFIPVLVFLYPYRIVFGGGGSQACLESSPVNRPTLAPGIHPP